MTKRACRGGLGEEHLRRTWSAGFGEQDLDRRTRIGGLVKEALERRTWRAGLGEKDLERRT